MKTIRKLVLYALVLCFLVTLCSCSNRYSFKYWNKDSATLKEIVDYVEDVTKRSSDNYIPEEDRIAVFDMDGTLCGEESPTYIESLLLFHRVLEDPNYKAPDEILEYAKTVKNCVENKTSYDETHFASNYAIAFSGMSVDEYDEYVKNFTENTICDGYSNLTYSESFFLPMVEIVDYLNSNGFKTYICSGTDRATCRLLVRNHINIKPENIIGCDIAYFPNGYEGSPKDSYEYKYENTLVRSKELVSPCWEGDKVNRIAIEIGKQPVMVFGNSFGDSSMAIYATDENPYKSMAVMIMNDDNVREHGDISKYEERKVVWDKYGWTTVSMKNDWSTIYGQNILKN